MPSSFRDIPTLPSIVIAPAPVVKAVGDLLDEVLEKLDRQHILPAYVPRGLER